MPRPANLPATSCLATSDNTFIQAGVPRLLRARMIAAALQDQWKKVGISLAVRPLEIATLFADLAKGSFQISYLRWVGTNNDPDVFELVFNSNRIPPHGPNRGRYLSARMDALTDQIRIEMDREKLKQLCR